MNAQVRRQIAASVWSPVANDVELSDQQMIDLTAREAYRYFTDEGLHAGGLVRDSARPGSPCSVAAAGFAAAAHVAAEIMGIVDRQTALRLCLEIARTFAALPTQTTVAEASDAAGHRGLFFHFIEADGERRGKRAWKSELSTIDTALLVAGLLTAAAHFDRDDEDEQALRDACNKVCDAVDWTFCLRPDGLLSHGWRPEAIKRSRAHHGRDGFIVHGWDGYDEGLLLYLLALGSPTHAIKPESYNAWCSTYARDWKTVEGIEHLHCPPLFTHQFPHSFADLGGVRDAFCRDRGLDYNENARRGTLAQIEYAKRNPLGFPGYGGFTWGLSASNGPGIDHKRQLGRNGEKMRFYPYVERGLSPPDGVVDDGTLAPWAAAASLPFAPNEVVQAIRGHRAATLCRPDWEGFMGSYNLAYIDENCPHGWVDEYDLAIEQAPIVMMAANHVHDGIWQATRKCGVFQRGLRAADFRGGWLD